MYFFVFISKNDIRRGTPYRPLQALIVTLKFLKTRRAKSLQKRLTHVEYYYMYFFVFISKNDIRRGTPYRPLQALILTLKYFGQKVSGLK